MSILLKTPLYPLHIEANAKMSSFAGYEMPIQYPNGILKEHLHCRSHAGLFDVSHMGQITLTGEEVEQIALELEKLIPIDVLSLPINRQKYALFTDEKAGILDDFMVANMGEYLLLVVNAACKQQDLQHLREHFSNTNIEVNELSDRSLLALQGPEAVKVLSRLNPAVSAMKFMDIQPLEILGSSCIVSRSGYTGEDGFEISILNSDAHKIAQALLNEPEVEWIGLGARDSLRLECGLCLYGHDMNNTTTPYDANLLWAISPARRSTGARPGNFPGAEILLTQIDNQVSHHKRVGLISQTKAPVREGTILYDSSIDGTEIGYVTSGTFAPSLGFPIAMAYIQTKYIALNQEVYAEVRKKRLPMNITKMPFVQQRYYKG